LFALVPMVADFLRNKRPEAVQQTGNRLADRAYALIVENGYRKYDRFLALDALWFTVAPALPLFLAGPNERLQTVCGALERFFDFTGRWDEWISLEQQAERKAIIVGDQVQAGWRAYYAGWIHSLRGQADAVLTCVERAMANFQTGKAGTRERAAGIRLRGVGHQLKKDYAAAISDYREVLELHRTLSDESLDVSIILNSLACAEQLSGDHATAERDYRESLRVARAFGHAEGEAIAMSNLACLALNRKDWPSAETMAREALTLSENLGRQELIAGNCHSLAEALVRQGHLAEVLPYARRAVAIFTRIGSPELKTARAILAKCEV